MDQVTVRKLDHTGQEIVAYPGGVLRRTNRAVVLRTAWGQGREDLGFVTLESGDRWTEYFYADRWYNVFEIRASDGRLKGWYCNVTRPAQITGGEVAAEDLALDLWVAPDRETRVLDEDEFAALTLSSANARLRGTHWPNCRPWWPRKHLPSRKKAAMASGRLLQASGEHRSVGKPELGRDGCPVVV